MHQLDAMQTRAELYETIGLSAYEALDRSIVATVLPPELRADTPAERGAE
jgi:methylisocitrate lyase